MSNESIEITLKQSVIETDHSQGSKDAIADLIQYGDYESRESEEANSIVQMIQNRFGHKLRFTYRHFVMNEVHIYARRAAEAVEAAGSQNRFWDMHYTLVAHQGQLNDGFLVEYAEEIGLDTTLFLKEVTSHIHLKRIEAQFQDGIASGVENTPTFFVNGVRFANMWNETGLIDHIEQIAMA